MNRLSVVEHTSKTMGFLTSILVPLAVLLVVRVRAEYRPVVLLPGLLSGCNNVGQGCLTDVAHSLRTAYPGIYIWNYTITGWDSLLIDLNTQVVNLFNGVNADPHLAHGFDIVAHSQGALLARGYIERYNSPQVHNLVSLAGPVNGVYGVPDFNALCPGK
jgi:palmitoyl-protein thioesterase